MEEVPVTPNQFRGLPLTIAALETFCHEYEAMKVKNVALRKKIEDLEKELDDARSTISSLEAKNVELKNFNLRLREGQEVLLGGRQRGNLSQDVVGAGDTLEELDTDTAVRFDDGSKKGGRGRVSLLGCVDHLSKITGFLVNNISQSNSDYDNIAVKQRQMDLRLQDLEICCYGEPRTNEILTSKLPFTFPQQGAVDDLDNQISEPADPTGVNILEDLPSDLEPIADARVTAVNVGTTDPIDDSEGDDMAVDGQEDAGEVRGSFLRSGNDWRMSKDAGRDEREKENEMPVLLPEVLNGVTKDEKELKSRRLCIREPNKLSTRPLSLLKRKPCAQERNNHGIPKQQSENGLWYCKCGHHTRTRDGIRQHVKRRKQTSEAKTPLF